MALNLTPEDLVKKLGLSTYEDGDQLISANKWENWNDKSGKDVQGFIKKRLADSVSSLEFIDQHLIAKNSMGEEQYAFDYYVSREEQKYYGIKCFYVHEDGSIEEEEYIE